MAASLLSARALGLLLGDWRDASAPAYQALADRMRLLVLDGRITHGRRLPAERETADRLGLSRTTVTAAYRRLRELGFATSRQGSGTVACLPGSGGPGMQVAEDELLDFSKATLPPTPLLVDAARVAVEQLPGWFGDSGFDPVGVLPLRAAIADWYGSRGLRTDPDQVMVTIGAQHAIALLARVLVDRGDRVLMEAPSYPHAIAAMRQAGGRIVPVSVTTDQGWDDAELQQAFRASNPALAYLMPDFHNPTGRTMGAEQREALLSAATRQGTVLVADETTAELDIDRREPSPPLAGYGPAVLVGSVGKTVWGGVRLGWIRAERPLIHKLVAARSAGDLGTPILEQLIVTELLREHWGAVLDGQRAVLRSGRAHLEAALAERMPEWTVPHVDGGLSIWVGLGAPVSSQLTLAVRAQGLLVPAGPRFGVDGAFERFLRIPIGLPEDQTDRALEALARAWSGLSRVSTPETGYLAAVV